MESKFHKSNTTIEVNLFNIIVMRPKLSRSANSECTQLQKFLFATGKFMHYLEKLCKFLRISLVKFCCVFNIN